MITGSEETDSNSKWINRQRTLIVCSHGVNHLQRDLANDIYSLLPQAKKEVKVNRKDAYEEVLELCQMRSCNNFIYFEAHKRRNLYMWLGKAPNGPSYKFFISNSKYLYKIVTSSKELKLTGNCIKGSRPILSFDAAFDNEICLELFKELAINAFTTPNFHPQSKPFIDHTLSFNFFDNKIWFRNYQIIRENKEEKLVEIGPRFCMSPIKAFDDFMSGEVLWSNPYYIPPAKKREMKIGAIPRRQLVKRKAKELIKKRKSEDLEKSKDNLFNKSDEE